MDEYNTEKFIEQYEHIKKLQLLSDNELNQLKRKRAHFEVSINTAKDVKLFIEYIKYESILMKKFKQIEYLNENDGRALHRSMCMHIRNIYKQAIRSFQDNRKMWMHYIEFSKSKYPESVTSIYQQMLNFHHTESDYIEAAKHEMDRQNYFVAINFLIQGMSNEKKNTRLVALNIECSLRQAEFSSNEKFQEKTLVQVTKYFNEYIKRTKDIQIYIELLENIKSLTCSISFQSQIIQYLLTMFCSRPEVWNLLADRHLEGLFVDESKEFNNPNDFPFNVRLKHAITIYDKSIEMVDDKYRIQMFDLYLTKLMELEFLKSNLDESDYQCIRYAFAKTLINGYKIDCLSEDFYIVYLKLCILNNKKFLEVKEIIDKGSLLYPNSMKFYEIAIKYYFNAQKFREISLLFNRGIEHNEKNAIQLYEFLCHIYMQNPNDTKRLRNIMMEAIESNNESLSANFQSYILEYYGFSEDLIIARQIYQQILNSKKVNSLSLKLFTTMIKLEQETEFNPDRTLIFDCFERATKIFGHNNADIWIEYIKYNWEIEEYFEGYNLSKRAMESLKNNLAAVENFELKYTMLRNNFGMAESMKEVKN
ncbi:U3 small nucleolar RNA-associated protein 6 homolog [Chironomus tepperi]|uniref:U3 small nucleolar RNA-associated protein 6 homolog n=1 Tax=Chironomus tepperi TaxID=113505 RepID=UPI00391FAFD8